METGKFQRLQALDISYTHALSENAIYKLLQIQGLHLKGLMLIGKPKLTENFWLNVIPYIKNIRSVGYHRLVGLVVKASASRPEDPGFESRLHWDFSGVESYQ